MKARLLAGTPGTNNSVLEIAPVNNDHNFPNLKVINHPLIMHKLSHMRDRETSTKTFRELLREIALLMGYEMTRDLAIVYKDIETPLCPMSAPVLQGKKPAIVPILRAGLGMADGLLDLMPAARVGHVGMYRDPDTKRPVEYMRKLQNPLYSLKRDISTIVVSLLSYIKC